MKIGHTHTDALWRHPYASVDRHTKPKSIASRRKQKGRIWIIFLRWKFMNAKSYPAHDAKMRASVVRIKFIFNEKLFQSSVVRPLSPEQKCKQWNFNEHRKKFHLQITNGPASLCYWHTYREVYVTCDGRQKEQNKMPFPVSFRYLRKFYSVRLTFGLDSP